jgi:hypothetical protein
MKPRSPGITAFIELIHATRSTTVVGLAIFLVAVLLSPETKGKLLIADLTVA